MRKKLSVLVLSVFILLLLPTVSVGAKKPQGVMDLEFNLGVPGLSDEIPDWVGTITFEGDEKTYGMLFFAIGTGKPFDNPNPSDSVHFFKEIWAIYDTSVDFKSMIPSGNPADWAHWRPVNNPEELVLWGYDNGLTNLVNSKYHMNGNIEEAFGAYSMWEGYNVHMSGIIEWYPFGAPYQAPGTFKIN